MDSEVLLTVRHLEQKAKINKKFEDLGQAANDLGKALEILNKEYTNTEDSEYKELLKRELSECYGMFGGIYRRLAKKAENSEESQKNLKASLDMYKKGKIYEDNDSYNLTNSLLIAILLDPSSLEQQQEDIHNGIIMIEIQVKGSRSDQWWAWADLGQLNVLKGNNEDALRAYRNFTQLGVRLQDYQSVLSVHEELFHALQRGHFSLKEQVARCTEQIMKFLQEKKKYVKL